MAVKTLFGIKKSLLFVVPAVLLLTSVFLFGYTTSSSSEINGSADATDQIKRSIYNLHSAEASQVSLRYPASSPEHLWLKQDNGKILIRRMAFYDARPQFDESLLLLISCHGSPHVIKPSFYIQIFYDDDQLSQSCQLLNYWKPLDKYHQVNNNEWVHYLMRVPVDGRKLPSFVAISRDNSCNDLSPAIPIYNDTRMTGKTGVFSVCTEKALFGNIDPQWLMQWIEFNLALGATYITIFIQSVKSELYDAIRPYQEEGIVEIFEWGIEEDKIASMWAKGIFASIQECILRNINRAEYLNLHDSDEILTPQKHTSWKDMINDLKSITDISRYASFSFPNEYWYDIGIPIKSAEAMMCPGNSSMKLPRYFMRTERAIKPLYAHPKAMIHLESVIYSNVHDISGWITGKQKEFKVPPNVGQSFHFRVPIREQDYIRFNLTYDPKFMLPYVKPIMTNLRKRFGC